MIRMDGGRRRRGGKTFLGGALFPGRCGSFLSCAWVLACLAGGGCWRSVDPAREELDRLLAAAPTIHHAGCDRHGACLDPRRICGASIESEMRSRLAGGEAILVEWEAPDEPLGECTFYWAINPDGSGEVFSDRWCARADDGCEGPGCGWSRRSVSPGGLMTTAGELRLTPGTGPALTDFAACDWP